MNIHSVTENLLHGAYTHDTITVHRVLSTITDPHDLYWTCIGVASAARRHLEHANGIKGSDETVWAAAPADHPAQQFSHRFIASHCNRDHAMRRGLFDALMTRSPDDHNRAVTQLVTDVAHLMRTTR